MRFLPPIESIWQVKYLIFFCDVDQCKLQSVKHGQANIEITIELLFWRTAIAINVMDRYRLKHYWFSFDRTKLYIYIVETETASSVTIAERLLKKDLGEIAIIMWTWVRSNFMNLHCWKNRWFIILCRKNLESNLFLNLVWILGYFF